jgi:hypothetical protein
VVSAGGGDSGLLANCSSALSAATRELATNTCADGHCPFFGKPAVFAYRLLAPLVDAATKAQWQADFAALDPWADYGFPRFVPSGSVPLRGRAWGADIAKHATSRTRYNRLARFLAT